MHRQHVSFDDVLQSRHESAIIAQLLVPPAKTRRENGANEHFIHRRVELNPGKAARECCGVLSKQFGKIRILKISNPIWHPKMAQIDNGDDLAPPQFRKDSVRERPGIFAWAQKYPV